MKQRILDIINPIAGNLGYEVVDVIIDLQNAQQAVTVCIYKQGGISLDDCELFHNAINAPMDTLDSYFGDTYVLNVSSPGLDREIRSFDDFRRNIGEEIEVFTSVRIDNKTKQIGFLRENNESDILLEIENKNKKTSLKIMKNQIVKARPYIRF